MRSLTLTSICISARQNGTWWNLAGETSAAAASAMFPMTGKLACCMCWNYMQMEPSL